MRVAGRDWTVAAGAAKGRDARTARAARPGPLPWVHADRDAGVRRHAFDRRRLPWGAERCGRGKDDPMSRTRAAPSPRGEGAARRVESSGGASSWWGGFYGTSNCSPSVLSTQPLAGRGPYSRSDDPFGVRLPTDQFHASRPRSLRIIRKQPIWLMTERRRSWNGNT